MPRGHYKRTPRAAPDEPNGDSLALAKLQTAYDHLKLENERLRETHAKLQAATLSSREQLDECHRIIGRSMVSSRMQAHAEDRPLISHRNGAGTRGNSHSD